MAKKTKGILKKDNFVCKIGRVLWGGLKWYGSFMLGLGKILLEGANDLIDMAIDSAKSDTAPKKDKKDKEKGDKEDEKE